MSEELLVALSDEILFEAACAGSHAARLLLDEMDPIGPCEYCSWDHKGQPGHFFGCPRWPDGEIVGSPIQRAKDSYVSGEIDASELELRVDRALQRSRVAIASQETEDDS